jgi:hypothetical protein
MPRKRRQPQSRFSPTVVTAIATVLAALITALGGIAKGWLAEPPAVHDHGGQR